MRPTGTDPTVPGTPGTALYEELLRNAPRMGRCPVVMSEDVLADACEERRVVEVAAVDPIDPEVVLANWWPGGPCLPGCPCEGEMSGGMPADPVGPSFPDLSMEPATIAAAARWVTTLDRLSMVDATRPADVPAAVGWRGIGNYEPYQDLERLCAVLRRWESRYGAMLVAVDRSRLHLAVARPPTTDDECRRVAAEHFAFCPDQQDPQDGTVHVLSSYARTIRGARTWHFWWD